MNTLVGLEHLCLMLTYSSTSLARVNLFHIRDIIIIIVQD